MVNLCNGRRNPSWLVVLGTKDLWPQLHAATPRCSCWNVINSIKDWENLLNTFSLLSSGACHLGRATNSQQPSQRRVRSQPPFQLQRVCTCHRARRFVVWTRQQQVQQQALCPLDDFLFLWECTWRVLLESNIWSEHLVCFPHLPGTAPSQLPNRFPEASSVRWAGRTKP